MSVRKINLCLEEINAKQVNRCVAWNGICFECELNKTQSWVAHLKTLQNIWRQTLFISSCAANFHQSKSPSANLQGQQCSNVKFNRRQGTAENMSTGNTGLRNFFFLCFVHCMQSLYKNVPDSEVFEGLGGHRWPVYEIKVAPSLRTPGTLLKRLRNIPFYNFLT